MRSVRVGWLTAIALGVLLGIYTASCGEDNRPEAKDDLTLAEAQVAAQQAERDSYEFCPCGFTPANGHQLRQHLYHCKQSPFFHVERAALQRLHEEKPRYTQSELNEAIQVAIERTKQYIREGRLEEEKP